MSAGHKHSSGTNAQPLLQSETPLPSQDPKFVDSFGEACLNAKSMVVHAVRMLAPSLEPEDIFQCACLQAFKTRAAFRGDAKFSTWFVTIALNCARSQLRTEFRRARSRDLFFPVDEVGDIQHQNENPEDRLLHEERGNQLFRAIAKLSKLSRRAVVARYYGEMSIKEVARFVGASESATKARLLNARLALWSALRQTSGDFSLHDGS